MNNDQQVETERKPGVLNSNDSDLWDQTLFNGHKRKQSKQLRTGTAALTCADMHTF